MSRGNILIPLVCLTGLPNFVGKLHDAASKVTGLSSESEPALLRCLRQQLETKRENILTAVETEKEVGDGVTQPHQDETTLLTIVEDKKTDSATSAPVADVDPPLSQGSNGQSREDPVKVKVPLPVPDNSAAPAPSSACSNVTSCSDNAQFLSSQPVYA